LKSRLQRIDRSLSHLNTHEQPEILIMNTISSKQPEPTNVKSELSLSKLIGRVQGFLLGDDIFISYSRSDSTNYAPVLAKLLSAKNFICYLDQYGSDIDKELPLGLRLKLRRSTVLVVIGSEKAVGSPFVKQEIELFKTTGRAIIPIDVDGAFMKAGWYELIQGLPISKDIQAEGIATKGSQAVAPVPVVMLPAATEQPGEPIAETKENLQAAQPSPKVINRIQDTFHYTKRTTWQRRSLIATVALILSSLATAGWFLNSALTASNQAAAEQLAAEIAKEQAADAEKKSEAAEISVMQAQRERSEANYKTAEAEGNARLAEDKANKAEEREKTAQNREAQATATAQQQERLAAEQKQIALSRQLASRARALADTRLDDSLKLSAQAYRAYDTSEARSSLLQGLQHHLHLQTILRFQRGAILQLAVSPNGETLASTTEASFNVDGQLVFWDVTRSEEIKSIKYDLDKSILWIAASPAGDRFATMDSERNIKLWSIVSDGSRKVVRENDLPPKLDYSRGAVSGAVFDSGGEVLIFPVERELIFCDINKGTQNAYPALTESSIISTLALSPDKQMLAVADGQKIELWDINKRQPLAVQPESPEAVESRDGFSDISFNFDGSIMAAALFSGRVDFWDMKSLKRLPYHLDNAGGEIAFSQTPNSKILVTANGKDVTVWNIGEGDKQPTEKWKETYRPGLSTFAFKGQASNNFLTGGGDGSVALWDIEAASILGQTRREGYRGYLAFTPDSSLLLAVNEGEELKSQLWSVSADPLSLQLSGADPTGLKNSSFRPVVSTEGGGTYSLRDSLNPTAPPVYLRLGKQAVSDTGYAISPDGRVFATVQLSSIDIWNIADTAHPKLLHQLKPKDGVPRRLAFDYSNKLLVTGYGSGKLILWDIAGEKVIREFTAPETDNVDDADEYWVESVAVSPGGKIVASSNPVGPIYLWDTSTGTLLGSLDRKTSMQDKGYDARLMMFSPDGKLLASSSHDGITLWSVDPISWSRVVYKITNSRGATVKGN
jgi:WD40 repeat protein